MESPKDAQSSSTGVSFSAAREECCKAQKRMIPAYPPYVLMFDDKFLGSRTSLVPSRRFLFYNTLFNREKERRYISQFRL